MDLTTITLEVSEHIATITLDRPESLNAFNGAMAAEMAHAWRTIRDDDDVHVVVLQANGDRAFSTGLDVTDDPSWFMRDNVWNSTDPGVLLSPSFTTGCGSRSWRRSTAWPRAVASTSSTRPTS